MRTSSVRQQKIPTFPALPLEWGETRVLHKSNKKDKKCKQRSNIAIIRIRIRIIELSKSIKIQGSEN